MRSALNRAIIYGGPVRLWWIEAALGAVVALLVLMFVAGMALAHEAQPTAAQPLGWSYPWSCCSNQDCRETKTGEVRETPSGYLIVATGETVPYQDKRIKDSPDGELHVCAHKAGLDAGKVICLFAPPRGF